MQTDEPVSALFQNYNLYEDFNVGKFRKTFLSSGGIEKRKLEKEKTKASKFAENAVKNASCVAKRDSNASESSTDLDGPLKRFSKFSGFEFSTPLKEKVFGRSSLKMRRSSTMAAISPGKSNSPTNATPKHFKLSRGYTQMYIEGSKGVKSIDRKELFQRYGGTKTSSNGIDAATKNNSLLHWRILRHKVKELIKKERKKFSAKFSLKDLMKRAVQEQQLKETEQLMNKTVPLAGLYNNRGKFSQRMVSVLKRNIKRERFRDNSTQKEIRQSMKKRQKLKFSGQQAKGKKKMKIKKEEESENFAKFSAMFKKNKLLSFKPYEPGQKKLLKRMMSGKFEDGFLIPEVIDDKLKKRKTGQLMLKFQNMLIHSDEVTKMRKKKEGGFRKASNRGVSLKSIRDKVPNDPNEEDK